MPRTAIECEGFKPAEMIMLRERLEVFPPYVLLRDMAEMLDDLALEASEQGRPIHKRYAQDARELREAAERMEANA